MELFQERNSSRHGTLSSKQWKSSRIPISKYITWHFYSFSRFTCLLLPVYKIKGRITYPNLLDFSWDRKNSWKIWMILKLLALQMDTNFKMFEIKRIKRNLSITYYTLLTYIFHKCQRFWFQTANLEKWNLLSSFLNILNLETYFLMDLFFLGIFQ